MALRRALQGKDKVRRFFHPGYRARSWSREHTVIARVEATSNATDIRFIDTNKDGRVSKEELSQISGR